MTRNNNSIRVGDRFVALNHPFHVVEILQIWPENRELSEQCEYLYLDDKLKDLGYRKGQTTMSAAFVIHAYYKRMKLVTQLWREINV